MKKTLFLFLGFALALGFSACHRHSHDDGFDKALLIGKWQEGSVYEHYYDTVFECVLLNGDTVWVNGTTWDESEDISEEEAQLFNWKLTGSTLQHEHVGTFIIVPKVYTVKSLDAKKLVYKDDYGTTHHFTKVE